MIETEFNPDLSHDNTMVKVQKQREDCLQTIKTPLSDKTVSPFIRLGFFIMILFVTGVILFIYGVYKFIQIHPPIVMSSIAIMIAVFLGIHTGIIYEFIVFLIKSYSRLIGFE